MTSLSVKVQGINKFVCICMYLQKNKGGALAGVAQWIEHWPVNRKFTNLIPGQGTCLGCGPGPQLRVCERQPHINVYFSLFLSLLLFLKENK